MKHSSLFATTALVLALSACGSEQPAEAPAAATPAADAGAAPVTEAIYGDEAPVAIEAAPEADHAHDDGDDHAHEADGSHPDEEDDHDHGDGSEPHAH